MRQVPLYPRAHERAFVGLGKHGFQSCVDVLIGDSSATKLPRDAQPPLAARARVLPRIIERVLRVVKILPFPQPGYNTRDERGFLRPPS